MANTKFNIYQAVTDRIIAQLEEGTIPWRKPWGGINSGAFNRISKKPYSLLNQMLLSHDGEYATFKQWKDLGGTVRKGEKSEIVVFWKMIETTECENGEEVKKTIPVLRYYNVFHISQVDGVKPLEYAKPREHEPIEAAEAVKNAYVEREGIAIKNVISNSAFYSPMGDYINMPLMKQFENIEEYYSTLFHEVTHSSGHKSRLNRFGEDTKLAAFGSADYSKEELVAELGSSFILTHLGIETDKAFNNSAAYIKSWLNVLKGDNRFIISAASKAEKAARFIMGEEVAAA